LIRLLAGDGSSVPSNATMSRARVTT
jgi:hypothetical protein